MDDDFDLGGGYSLWSDTPDIGTSWDYQPQSNSFDTSWLNAYTNPTPTTLDSSWLMPRVDPYAQGQGGAYYGPAATGSRAYDVLQAGGKINAQGVPQGGGSILDRLSASLTQDPRNYGGGGTGQQANPWISGLLGAAGPLAGLIGALAGGGKGPTTGPQPTTAQKANMATGNQLAQMGAQGQLPAQQMQMSLLQALAGGQGLPPGYASLVEQAFQPQMGDLYTQAAQMGRRKGFYDAPATSPPGGAILGPGLANIQGQMAAAKLGLMHSLPQLFNAPAQTQGSFAQNYLQAAQGAPMQQGSQQPIAPMIANNVGNILSGAAQGYNAGTQQNQQQQTLNSILEALKGNQVAGMSYTKQ